MAQRSGAIHSLEQPALGFAYFGEDGDMIDGAAAKGLGRELGALEGRLAEGPPGLAVDSLDFGVPAPDVVAADGIGVESDFDLLSCSERDGFEPGKKALAVNGAYGAGSGGEADVLEKLSFEPSGEAMAEAGAGDLELKIGAGPGRKAARVIESAKNLRLAQELFALGADFVDAVEDQRKSGLEIEAAGIFPGRGAAVVVIRDFEDRSVNGVALRNQDGTISQEAVAGIFDRGKGFSKKRKSAANVGDDDVGAFR